MYKNDERFIPVKLKIVHSGLTAKGFYFTESSLYSAANTLANVPILAKFSRETQDAMGHEYSIKRSKIGKEHYLHFEEVPVGLIPESSEIEINYEDDKLFMYATGLIWERYANEMKYVLQRDEEKSISMEIVVMESESRKDGTIEVKEFGFSGITILGESYVPGVTGAVIKILQSHFAELGEKENFTMDFNLKNKNWAVFTTEGSVTAEPTVTGTVDSTAEASNAENTTVEPTIEPQTTEEGTEVAIEEGATQAVTEVQTDVPGSMSTEELSALAATIAKLIQSQAVTEQPKEEAKTTDDKSAEIEQPKEDTENSKESSENLDNEKKALLDEIALLKETVTVLVASQKRELIGKFTDLKEYAEYTELVSTMDNHSVEELETKLYAIRGKYADTKATKEVAIPIVGDRKTSEPKEETLSDRVAAIVAKYEKRR